MPSADTLAFALIAVGAVPATGFAIVFGFFRPWWRTWLSRALMVNALGMALLLDISLIYQVFGDDYALRDVVRLTVYALIVAGLWGKFLSLLFTPRHHTEK